MSKALLLDKIRGGWAGQTIGCTYGGPTEFRYKGTFLPDEHPIPWDDGSIARAYKTSPGLYDDVYMDLTFVKVLEAEGLAAKAESFAKAFATAPYPLWHANQMARSNILAGLMPPASGHWLNNPHADDIDFQIEADFAGLMAPGLPDAAAEVCDRTGHIMNYGDGWYGGVYMAQMLSLAFVESDIPAIAEKALGAIPAASGFAKAMREVLDGWRANPTDWRATWFRVQRRFANETGCPEGVFSTFDIDAKMNAAWVLTGLLYGGGDFGRTIDIATRCGDDSDCNPASAAGILGVLYGLSGIPEEWKAGLAAVEDIPFPYVGVSLRQASDMSLRHALAVVEANGGRVDGEKRVHPGPGAVPPAAGSLLPRAAAGRAADASARASLRARARLRRLRLRRERRPADRGGRPEGAAGRGLARRRSARDGRPADERPRPPGHAVLGLRPPRRAPPPPARADQPGRGRFGSSRQPDRLRDGGSRGWTGFGRQDIMGTRPEERIP